MVKHLAFIFYICSITFIYSQKIGGEVKDQNGAVIENASIFVWNSIQKQKLLGYYYTNEHGVFEIPLQIYDGAFIEISKINFQIFSKQVKGGEIMLVLLQKNDLVLEEVVIKNEKAVRVKNDSTFYNPTKFLDGTENKVEDLLKKLPGITVNESTGQIKFKGKEIETVKLEDDDLFGSNYTVGTKHISVEMVEQVQAIENYSSNSILKNIENTDKVVLNLKLKARKTDFSGDVTSLNGFEKKILTSNEFTILGINRKIKQFGFITQANFGVDTSNIEPVSEENRKKFLNVDYNAYKNITAAEVNSFLPAKRTTFNEYIYTNSNVLYKFNTRFKVKNNIFFLNDHSKFAESNRINYLNNVNTATDEVYYNSPLFLRIDTKATYNTSLNSLLESDFVFKVKSLKSTINTLLNNSNIFNSALSSTDLFFKSKVEYTLKLSNKSALQFTTLLSYNDLPQQLITSPSSSLLNGTIINTSEQASKFSKKIIEIDATYLFSRRNRKNTIAIIYLCEENPFTSRLFENEVNLDSFTNNFLNRHSIISSNFDSAIRFSKVNIHSFISFNSSNQKVGPAYAANNFVNYLLLSTYTNKKHAIDAKNEVEFKLPIANYLFSNVVFTDNNALKNNVVTQNLIKTNRTQFNYKYDDLIKLFLINLNYTCTTIQNSYTYNLNINPNFLSYTYFQNQTNIQSESFTLHVDKSFKSINIALKHSSSFLKNKYQNSIDNFEIRNNFETVFLTNLYLISSFDFPANLESKFNLSTSTYQSEKTELSRRTSLNYILRIILKPFQNTTISISQDFYKNDLNSRNSFSLLDFNMQYKSRKYKWLNLNLFAKNVLNTANFEQIINNDYSTTLYRTQLIARHFLLATTYNF